MSILNNQMFTTNTKNLELPPLSAEMLWGFLLYPCLGNQSYETNLKNTTSRNISPVPQSIIVDTTTMTAGDITILWDKGDLNYQLVVPYGCKHVFSVPAIADCVYSVTFSSDAVGGDVRMDLVNFPLIPQSYSVVSNAAKDSVSVTNFPATQTVAGAVSLVNFPSILPVEGTVSVGTALPSGSNIIGSVNIQPANGPLSDYSLNIPAANTNYVLSAANANRRYLFISNNSSGTIFVNFGAAASIDPSNYQLSDGESLTMDSNYVNTESINVMASAAGLWCTCKTA